MKKTFVVFLMLMVMGCGQQTKTNELPQTQNQQTEQRDNLPKEKKDKAPKEEGASPLPDPIEKGTEVIASAGNFLRDNWVHATVLLVATVLAIVGYKYDVHETVWSAIKTGGSKVKNAFNRLKEKLGIDSTSVPAGEKPKKDPDPKSLTSDELPKAFTPSEAPSKKKIQEKKGNKPSTRSSQSRNTHNFYVSSSNDSTSSFDIEDGVQQPRCSIDNKECGYLKECDICQKNIDYLERKRMAELEAEKKKQAKAEKKKQEEEERKKRIHEEIEKKYPSKTTSNFS